MSTSRFFSVFAIAMMVIGLAMLAFGSIKLVDGLSTASWSPATATIVDAEQRRSYAESGSATKHDYRVTAEYTVEGETYSLSYTTNRLTVEPRVGATQSIRFDPSNPADARRGTGTTDLVAGPIVIVIGIALGVGGVLLFRRSRRGPISLPSYRASWSTSRKVDPKGR
jgi:hypothetical protein